MARGIERLLNPPTCLLGDGEEAPSKNAPKKPSPALPLGKITWLRSGRTASRKLSEVRHLPAQAAL